MDLTGLLLASTSSTRPREHIMKVPFTISDFLYRAENVYSDRIALIDEPDTPGGGLGELTWGEFGVKVRQQAAKLDDLGIGTG